GAGAYVCGEETALFQSIEGKRGEPRNKPPFPVEVGLFGKPTVVNNVETLFNVLEVLRLGGSAYAETGTEGSAGTRLFCVSGSGVVIVYDDEAELVPALLRIAEFFRDESCGQCVPCRVGTVRQEEAVKRLAAGRPHADELHTLGEVAQVMRDASICGLGQTAANAVESAIVNLGVFER